MNTCNDHLLGSTVETYTTGILRYIEYQKRIIVLMFTLIISDRSVATVMVVDHVPCNFNIKTAHYSGI